MSRTDPANRRRLRSVIAGALSALMLALLVAPQLTSAAAGLASDSFSRHIQTGWGRADVGGQYTLSGNRRGYSVERETGVMTIRSRSASYGATLRQVRARNVDLRFRFKVARKPVAGGVHVAAVVRKVDGRNEYAGRITLLPRYLVIQVDRMVGGIRRPLTRTRTLRIAPAPNRFYHVRLKATGSTPTNLRFKVWAGGSREPGWQLAASDHSPALDQPGGIGFRTNAVARLRPLPLRVAFDSVQAAEAAAPAPAGPRIIGVRAYNVTRTSAKVTWTLDQPSTGQVEFGRTTAYDRRTTLENSFRYTTHVQDLVNLSSGTTYHYRVKSRNRAGKLTVSGDYTFRTDAAPNPDPPPPSGGAMVYGAGIAGDSKANIQVGWIGNQAVSHRFRASTTADLVGVRFAARGGPGYSGGNGGQMRITVRSDDGTANHRPSGTVLASLTMTPGNPGGHWEHFNRYTFASPPRLTAGRLYHIVFENTGNAPGDNYISVNELFTFEAESTPRQPALSDDYSVLVRRSGGWSVKGTSTGVMDLTYANGVHDGQAYIGVIVEEYALIGGNDMVRERFTVSGGNRTVQRAFVRVGQQYGNSPLTIRLERGDGTLIAQGTVAASSIPSFSVGTATDNGDWVGVTFSSSHVLQNGQTYNLRLSAPGDTRYSMVPIRDGNDDAGGHMASYAFRDGSGQMTTGGGWSDMYRWSPVDIQFYFR